MNFNKCCRCGAFFLSESAVCPNCKQKDELEINRLKNYIEETNYTNYDISQIVASTGISNKNLNRFLMQEQFADFANQIQKTKLD